MPFMKRINANTIEIIFSIYDYYLEAIFDCDSMSKYELCIGLEGFPLGTPGPWYRAILTDFSVVFPMVASNVNKET